MKKDVVYMITDGDITEAKEVSEEEFLQRMNKKEYNKLIEKRDQLSNELNKCNEQIEEYKDSELLERIKNIDLNQIKSNILLRKRHFKFKHELVPLYFDELIHMVADFSNKKGYWKRFASECLDTRPNADDEELIVWYIEEIIVKVYELKWYEKESK